MRNHGRIVLLGQKWLKSKKVAIPAMQITVLLMVDKSQKVKMSKDIKAKWPDLCQSLW